MCRKAVSQSILDVPCNASKSVYLKLHPTDVSKIGTENVPLFAGISLFRPHHQRSAQR